mmetsp:Transcript_21058/g.65269  ORF Transcript_21058/g.65269 Transcript_21058/m.65269 type:complete len:357 (-) Transcript_21058:36-1106(-)
MPVIRSPGRVAAAPIAPSARIFTRRATTVLQTSLLTQGQHCRLRPACFPPRVVHRARSCLHSRPHTCVLSRETRQYACGRGGRREVRGALRAWAAWLGGTLLQPQHAWRGRQRHTHPRVVRGAGRDRGTDGRRVRAVRASRRFGRVGAAAPPPPPRRARHFTLVRGDGGVPLILHPWPPEGRLKPVRPSSVRPSASVHKKLKHPPPRTMPPTPPAPPRDYPPHNPRQPHPCSTRQPAPHHPARATGRGWAAACPRASRRAPLTCAGRRTRAAPYSPVMGDARARGEAAPGPSLIEGEAVQNAVENEQTRCGSRRAYLSTHTCLTPGCRGCEAAPVSRAPTHPYSATHSPHMGSTTL